MINGNNGVCSLQVAWGYTISNGSLLISCNDGTMSALPTFLYETTAVINGTVICEKLQNNTSSIECQRVVSVFNKAANNMMSISVTIVLVFVSTIGNLVNI